MDVTMLVNKAHPLAENFRPDGLIDLFSLEDQRFFLPPKRMLLESSAAQALNRMCAAAEREAGLTEFQVFSAWRSHEHQALIYERRRREGYVALPGCSEHETGLAVDLRADGLEENHRHLEWLEENGWRFGYILRYPAGREHITGIGHEPWHYRYVGEELASLLHENKWMLEEYYDRSIPATDPYGPAFIFRSIFGAKMKGHWQTWPDIDLEDLRNVNPATVGWVHMEGTPIDYPVVGATLSRDWCLKYNFSGEPSCHGMIRLESVPGTGDLLLRGHQMRDASMFMKLNELRAVGSFDAHPVIELNLEGVRYTARWFAALHERRGPIPMPDSNDPADRGAWLRDIRARSVCASDTAVVPEDRILCCATCASFPMQSILYAVLRPAQGGRA